jgi:hypothetical protein
MITAGRLLASDRDPAHRLPAAAYMCTRRFTYVFIRTCVHAVRSVCETSQTQSCLPPRSFVTVGLVETPIGATTAYLCRDIG